MPITVEQLTLLAQQVFGSDRVQSVTCNTPLFEYHAIVQLATEGIGFEGGISIDDIVAFATRAGVKTTQIWVRNGYRAIELWISKPVTSKMTPQQRQAVTVPIQNEPTDPEDTDVTQRLPVQPKKPKEE